MNNELKQIKKIYGEEMMHLCRELFPSILEQEGKLLNILTNNLAPTHSFASDIKEYNLYEKFKRWIYSFIDIKKENIVITDKTPFELMEEAGYTLYECKSEEEIQEFKKYYAQKEELCTFRGDRLDRCYVFFAVKKNVDEIKRENFKNPEREDEYGTSVISIQFSRDNHTLSIKNRYNHTVNNPDATFSNNLENIISGLTSSFEKYNRFKINQQEKEETFFLTNKLPYTKGNDGKFYRYNIEIDGIYYCENNIIISDGKVLRKCSDNKERFLLIDHYIIDLKEKSIRDCAGIYKSFAWSIYDVGEIEQIYVSRNGKNRLIHICYKDRKEVTIEINQNNAIVGYENNYIMEIYDDFLRCNKKLKNINLLKVQIIGDNFLHYNKQLSSISLPEVEVIGDGFLCSNNRLESVSLPEVREIGNYFLYRNEQLKSISLPQVQEIRDSFLCYSDQLKSILLPEVREIGDEFLCYNNQIKCISLPEVQKIGKYFLLHNTQLKSISLPQVQEIGNYFLYYNDQINNVPLSQKKDKNI